MQVNSASNRKIFVFLFCVFVNYYNAFWITVRTLITFDGQIPKGTVNFHDGFKADGRQVS
jgi:hypothetical protein